MHRSLSAAVSEHFGKYLAANGFVRIVANRIEGRAQECWESPAFSLRFIEEGDTFVSLVARSPNLAQPWHSLANVLAYLRGEQPSPQVRPPSELASSLLVRHSDVASLFAQPGAGSLPAWEAKASKDYVSTLWASRPLPSKREPWYRRLFRRGDAA